MAHSDEQPAVVYGDTERIDPGEGGDLVLRAEGEALEQHQLLRIDDENAGLTLERADVEALRVGLTPSRTPESSLRHPLPPTGPYEPESEPRESAGVDVSEADWRQCGSCVGGADRSSSAVAFAPSGSCRCGRRAASRPPPRSAPPFLKCSSSPSQIARPLPPCCRTGHSPRFFRRSSHATYLVGDHHERARGRRDEPGTARRARPRRGLRQGALPEGDQA